MKAAEATDGLRASAKPPRDLPAASLGDRKMERAMESRQPLPPPCPVGAAAAAAKAPPLAADACSKHRRASAAAGMAPSGSETTRESVLTNLMQTGGVKSQSLLAAAAPGAATGRRRCSCGELNRLPGSNGILNGHQSSHGSCNCNAENCAWEEAPLKSRPWRSSSDQTSSNAALHRALSSMKKMSAEPNSVKKLQPRAPPSSTIAADLQTCEAPDMKARSITNPDARTVSMRERGRWGSGKLQQHFPAQPACTLTPATGGLGVKANVCADRHLLQHHQALQHMQCQHCGSFSTTPVLSYSQGARSQSFGRKLRDFSWQQELLQEQRRPEPNKEVVREESKPAPQHAAPHSRCECAAGMIDSAPELEQFHAQIQPKLNHIHGGSVMSWQDRYMLLCQAIAAGAFVDGCADDMSGPMFPSNRGYSWAVCECAACEMSCSMAEPMGFRHGPSSYCNTSSGERMMELEAFSGPIGYVSESKAGAELSSILEKQVSSATGRRRWWARLPSFGKSKSNSHFQAVAAAQTTKQCSLCGQRVCLRRDEELSRWLCPECNVKSYTDKYAGAPTPGAARPAPAPARAAHPHPPPLFSRHQKQLPRRWRLMKLCRYLMGFPLQR